MINDPKILKLNETQLFFEAESINIEIEKKYEDMALMAGAAKKAVINLLGLNIMPVEDKVTKLMRMPEDHEVIPLIAAIGHEGLLKEVKDRLDDMEAQEIAKEQLEKEKELGQEVATEDFLDFMESDIDFIDDAEMKRLAVVNSPEYEMLNKNVVKDMNKVDKKDFDQLFGVDSKMSPQEIRQVLSESEKKPELEIEEMKAPENIKIEPENVVLSDDVVKKKRKVKIIIEADDEE